MHSLKVSELNGGSTTLDADTSAHNFLLVEFIINTAEYDAKVAKMALVDHSSGEDLLVGKDYDLLRVI
jgi:hypothetical protein